MELQGRDFNLLQQKLVEIPVPAQILTIGTKSTGSYYAILRLDRPSAKKKKTSSKAKIS